MEEHLTSYIEGFSHNIREIFERFEFAAEIEKMSEANILYLVVSKFCDIDLHPDEVYQRLSGNKPPPQEYRYKAKTPILKQTS